MKDTVIKAKKVEKAFGTKKDALTKREKEVISRYYGIDKQVRHSLREIGELFGVTRERIRQIKVEALSKINVK